MVCELTRGQGVWQHPDSPNLQPSPLLAVLSMNV